jgi:hypothetical protein
MENLKERILKIRVFHRSSRHFRHLLSEYLPRGINVHWHKNVNIVLMHHLADVTDTTIKMLCSYVEQSTAINVLFSFVSCF